MFRQYQHQDTIRSISAVSQSSETMECVNGPPAEETAPSTIIELTVGKLSQKLPDSASRSTITSSPLEAGDERGQASITVSNILAEAEEEQEQQRWRQQQQLVEESTRDGADVRVETVVVTQKAAADEQSEDDSEQKAEASTDKTSLSDTADTKAVDVGKDSTSSDDAHTAVTDDEKSESEHNKGETSNSMTEDSLNEADAELPAGSEQENSVLGGASVFNEDLVDVSSVSDQVHASDADDSQEESSYTSAATGEEAGYVKKEEDDKNGQEEEELKMEEEKVEKQEAEVEQVACVESQTPPAEKPEKSVTEAPKEKTGDEQSSSIAEAATTSQQPSDGTPPSTAQEVAAASDSPSDSQPSETSGATRGETPSGSSDISTTTTTTTSDTQKTKEIKIARLDVSNVALDTERLELKVTSTTVCIFF